MRHNRRNRGLWNDSIVSVVAAAVFVACGTSPENRSVMDKADVLAADTPVDASQSEIQSVLTVKPFEDPLGVGGRGQTANRALIKTAAGYQRYFGHAAPLSVNFSEGDIVLFYAAGSRPTGGYSARFVSASTAAAGTVLFATSQLTSPGKDCFVTQALSAPYALATVRPARKPSVASFNHSDVVEDCNRPPNPCETVRCKAGYHCEVITHQCFTTPCEPSAECVEDPPPPAPSACAAVLCPVGTVCVEKPVQCITTPCPPVAECVPLKGQPCGAVTCGTGLVCCNSSCNMCTRPDEACIQIACN